MQSTRASSWAEQGGRRAATLVLTNKVGGDGQKRGTGTEERGVGGGGLDEMNPWERAESEWEWD